jgi:predicted nucleic acid-binding Zn ribbon protein
MPRYSYTCSNCGNVDNLIIKASEFDPRDTITCTVCKHISSYTLPKNLDGDTYEVNKFRGTSRKTGVEKQVRKRFKKHTRKYDYQKIIDKHGYENNKQLAEEADKT